MQDVWKCHVKNLLENAYFSKFLLGQFKEPYTFKDLLLGWHHLLSVTQLKNDSLENLFL